MSEMRVLILKEGTSRSRGREAQRSNIMAAKVLAETVRSTIGPKGMDKMPVNIKPDDHERLRQIAITSLNTKGIFGSQTRFADLAVDAVKQVMEKREGKVTADIDLVKVMKKHGQSLNESELVNGIIIDKEVAHADMPKRVTGGGILLLNAKLESQKTETSAKINIDRPEDMFSFIAEEENLLEKMAEDVAKTGA